MWHIAHLGKTGPYLAGEDCQRAALDFTSCCLWMCRYSVITDKGTFDAIGLSEAGAAQQLQYIDAVHSLLQSGGLLIITSCNSTLQEVIQAFTCDNRVLGDTVEHRNGGKEAATERPVPDDRARETSAARSHPCAAPHTLASRDRHQAVREALKTKTFKAQKGASSSPGCPPRWVYVDHVRTYKVYSFGGFEGSRVCTAAFKAA